jgi:hypothetical protein
LFLNSDSDEAVVEQEEVEKKELQDAVGCSVGEDSVCVKEETCTEFGNEFRDVKEEPLSPPPEFHELYLEAESAEETRDACNAGAAETNGDPDEIGNPTEVDGGSGVANKGNWRWGNLLENELSDGMELLSCSSESEDDPDSDYVPSKARANRCVK